MLAGVALALVIAAQWPASAQVPTQTPPPPSTPAATETPTPPVPLPPSPEEGDQTPSPEPAPKSDDKDPEPVCSTLSWTQTYRGWGPALSYRRAVTIRYAGLGCSVTEGTSLDLLRKGTARVYAGPAAKPSRHIDTRVFSVSGVWEEPDNPLGWPPSWWQCDVSGARFTWQVRGVYTFAVGVDDGVWSLDVDTNRKRKDHHFHWSYNGCS